MEPERFDDLDEGFERKRFAPSQKFILGVVVAGVCAAVVACVASWHAGRSSVSHPATPLPAPVPTAQVAKADPVPAMPAMAKAEPISEVAQTAAAQAAPAVAKTDRVANQADVRDRCKKAIGERRNKETLTLCTQAFEADPSAADAAAAVAKVEFDRGRSAQALAWGKKAIAADPNTAEAYVFIGSAEQSAGHGKAAKEAYRRYLQLAPGGRYAADLRSIVGSL